MLIMVFADNDEYAWLTSTEYPAMTSTIRYVAQAINAMLMKFVKILKQINWNHSLRLNTRLSFVSAKNSYKKTHHVKNVLCQTLEIFGKRSW